MNKRQKFIQTAKEAKATWIALLLIILFWFLSGIVISYLDITIYYTPLWAITGCLGTWIFSIVVVIILTKKIFKDFDLDEEEDALDE